MRISDKICVQIDDSVLVENRITQVTIDNLKHPKFTIIQDEEVSDYIFQYCIQLLRFSMERHESKEIAYAINLNTLEFVGAAFGNSKTVDLEELIIKMEDSECVFLVLHNHPSDCTFSPKDINTFVEAANIVVLVVIGNRGSIYILEKTRPITGSDFVDVKKVIIGYRNGMSGFEETVRKLSDYGIVL